MGYRLFWKGDNMTIWMFLALYLLLWAIYFKIPRK
nr:MAG TPA: hypothetical protein [Caudoviricetes sp.]